MKRKLREHIYIISEISIDMNRECARFARSNNYIDDFLVSMCTSPQHRKSYKSERVGKIAMSWLKETETNTSGSQQHLL